MKITRLIASALLGTAVVVLTACGTAESAGDPQSAEESAATAESSPGGTSAESPGTDAQAEAPAMNLVKSGGVAGVNTTLEVAADGAWTLDDGNGNVETGTLTEAEMADLTAYATDEDLAVTDRPDKPNTQCNDMFNYVLTVGDLEMRTDSCGQPPNEPFKKIIEVLSGATGI